MNVLSLFDGMSCGQIALNRLKIPYVRYYASEIDKFAIKVAKKNYPNTIHLGGVTKIKASNLPKIDLLIGGSPCFVKETKVITQNGYKDIIDITIDDKVLTHKNRFKKVIRTGFTENKEIWEIQAQGFKKICTTENHPFPVRTMTRVWDNSKRSYVRTFSKVVRKKVNNLSKNDFLGLPILQTSENTLNITKEEAYIIGRYIADGHTAKNHKYSKNGFKRRHYELILSIGKHKKADFDKIKSLHFTLRKHTQSTFRVSFYSKRLVNIVENNCGCGAINKYLSATLLNLPVDLLKEVLHGYIDGGGSVRGKEYRATSISEKLILTLNLAIAKVYNVNSSYEYNIRPKTCKIEDRIVNQHDTFCISFRKEMKKQSNAIVIDDIIWLPIKKITNTYKRERVFNLEVEEDHSYTADNCMTFNCQGFSFAGKGLNFDDPRSKLFFEYARLLKELKPKYFLLENVKMTQESQKVISLNVGLDPILIDSVFVSAQYRKRLYWTNIKNIKQPEDKHIYLKDILDYSIPNNILTNEQINIVKQRKKYGKSFANNSLFGTINSYKHPCLCTGGTSNVLLLTDLKRYITPLECERLQTVPDNYTADVVSDRQRYKMLGNGWTVDVIVHILKNIEFSKYKIR